ncbi:hypothetical protein EDD68_101274 [Melghiribacillus thermohalophilus]|uniref:Peptidyl-prolyl cis-trans isomerase n=1 Tax=Melghiribacillus thermohalophilus TaxID=1324956 RepID=A0A4R3NBD1_9BACI|nr:hypothetical protein [Melghiribacillus thermohalophilus]TCT26917.1 hypothetical protein EDD68_101274 [Melghiribacillus thermohalophilus]
MIIQLTGKVNYHITLDPGVWIFDDRKIEWEQAFGHPLSNDNPNGEEEANRLQQRWSREVYQQKINPPINKSISKFERNEILKGTYVMPIKPFIENAEIQDGAETVILSTSSGEHEISVNQLTEGYFLFARNGKPIKEDGPVYFYFGDGSNKDTPIKGVKQIIVT